MFLPRMFHVEHSKTLLIVAISLFFSQLLTSCSKPDPNPELSDPIYLDMKTQLTIVEKSLVDAKAKIAESKTELKDAVPQTGQVKQAQKKLFQYEKLHDLYQQQIKYWLIRIQERGRQARLEYTSSRKSGTPWPNPKEFESYASEKKLRLAKIQWDAKKRLEDYKAELNPKKSGGQSGAHEAPSGQEPAAEGGGEH